MEGSRNLMFLFVCVFNLFSFFFVRQVAAKKVFGLDGAPDGGPGQDDGARGVGALVGPGRPRGDDRHPRRADGRRAARQDEGGQRPQGSLRVRHAAVRPADARRTPRPHLVHEVLALRPPPGHRRPGPRPAHLVPQDRLPLLPGGPSLFLCSPLAGLSQTLPKKRFQCQPRLPGLRESLKKKEEPPTSLFFCFFPVFKETYLD